MALIYEQIQRQGQDCLRVTGSDSPERDLAVPERARIQGDNKDSGGAFAELSVVSIGSHAFESRKELRTVRLPAGLKELRPFAFYNCTDLASIELFNTTDDYYDGVIRQCPALRLITVHCTIPENYIIVREMLQDVDVTLRFRLLTGRGEVRLTFPEYVSEAREDTMARAIHFSIEGAGMAYRECVGKKTLDLTGYDSLLGRLTDYDFAVAADIALGRLLCPVELSEEAKRGYEDFLRANDEKVLRELIRLDAEENRTADVRLMCGRHLIGTEALGPAMEYAADMGRVEIGAILMEYRNQEFPDRKKDVFQLSW